MLRRGLHELTENHVVPLRKLLHSDSKITAQRIAIYRDQKKEFQFPNGSRIILGYCNVEQDVLQYQGQSYDVIMMEEATQFTEFQFQTLTESNRSSGLCKGKKFKPRMYFTCNPGGVGHAWFKRLFIDREYKGKENPDDYCFIQSLVYENEYLMENDPDYVRTLENLPEERRKAMLYGNWDVFDGQYFRNWSRETHVIEPFDIPEYWNKYISIDWGYNDYCSVLWHAMGDDGHIYTYREIHVREKSVNEIADLILLNNGNDVIRSMIGSPDMWHTRGLGDTVTGENVADMFAKRGLFFTKADNSRISGWNRMREYMQKAPDGKPWWVITSNCASIIKCIPQAMYDDNKTEDMATEPHEITDPLDSARYFIMSRPQPSKTINIDSGNKAGAFYSKTELEDFKKCKKGKKTIKNSTRVERRIG